MLKNNNTGKSHFRPGLCSWKTSCKLKLLKSNTKFPYKTACFLGLGGWQPYHIWCVNIPLVDIWTSGALMYYIYRYISTKYFCFLMQEKRKRLMSMVFVTVHPKRAVLVLHFGSWLSTVCNSIPIITNCACANMSVQHYDIYQQIYVPSWSQRISLLLIVFCQFFSSNEQGNLDFVSHSFFCWRRN